MFCTGAFNKEKE
jgi:hypothetical protein